MATLSDDTAAAPDRMSRKDVLVAVGLAEFTALLIALVTPFTPSKTGGGPLTVGDLLFDDPSYLHHVVVGFLLVNAVMGVLALVCWVWIRWGRRRNETGAAQV